MGRGRRHRDTTWKRNQIENSNENVEKPIASFDSNNFQKPICSNLHFEEYYKEQRIVKAEEWDSFMEFLHKPLPAAFRVNSNGQFCDEIRLKLENDFMKSLQAEAIESGELEAIKPLPWYPKTLAWHSNFSRKEIRKNQILERFHEFLKLETEVGNMTRQESVSMVPPLFLDVHPDHFVLDMCAAPGSKTFQLLEIIHESSEPGSLPNGMVVANDVDYKRCNLLIHQTKRTCTTNLMVTNNEGQHFPSCNTKRTLSVASEINPHPIDQLLFDRVLCDVPCSGDGTLRKAPDIWRRWNSGSGNGLHSLQVVLAMRGLSLLKVGGRMIYSTCSMNPIEDEAVVAEILRRCGCSVELVDVSDKLPELIRRPGLTKWKVHDRGGWYRSYKDVPKSQRDGVLRSMFPSGKSDKDSTGGGNSYEEMAYISSEESAVEVCDLPLERCMRILPHDQNTGGFFIAVLHKVSPLPEFQEKLNHRRNSFTRNNINSSEKSSYEAVSDTVVTKPEEGAEEIVLEATVSENGFKPPEKESTCDEGIVELAQKLDDMGGKREVPSMQGKWKGLYPVVFLRDETVIDGIKTFYGIKDETFPLYGHLVTRNSDISSHGNVKRIYYVSKAVKDVLELNFAVGKPLKISSVGLKMFEKQSAKECEANCCSFRITSEGLPVILPHMTKQILYATMADFKNLLQHKSIKFLDFIHPQIGEKAAKLALGSCVMVLVDDTQLGSEPVKLKTSTIAIGCWKGKASLTVMVTTVDCHQLIERLSDRSKEVEIAENCLKSAETA
ncbi:tRNA (cytosine(34)-C(5))-methyltransferase isoform X2 [Arabidopsis lyrata subsp. lyrata]|uniref:tRNA (cytosine(34)-C(5))-methyltransferase isoform X2 n=1 Tax=Arabidopsis lyrata subsp. lyrata TaxID=81972 RepID=UPI000A29D7E2|nr:tRNA (cytosine(34)-C(5))-methyltransferase isoform X2 [Arabidopsis lyrata subsp. lyrata]|eukprot:XP_020872882.1 tRNA (cytosine(34)-C(5))-methyltransferase isoform X2 [Arabidopsis lyrata subsp. lyrata]